MKMSIYFLEIYNYFDGGDLGTGSEQISISRAFIAITLMYHVTDNCIFRIDKIDPPVWPFISSKWPGGFLCQYTRR